jgi:uncharacterized protein YndB with AHSA1/START domain
MSTKNNPTIETTGFKLAVTRVINAPCEKVFRAWTEPQQLAQWFSPAEVELRDFKADVKIGGAFRIHYTGKKGEFIASGNYQEIVLNRRLKFSWTWKHYAMPDSVVTVDFEDLGKTTRLTLLHEGLPDQEDADQHTHGWTSMVEKFAQLIEQSNLQLKLSRVFDAPRELVFKAWTDANQFKEWFGAAACEGSSLQSMKVDARVGGKYRLQVRRADGDFFTTVGIYHEVKPPERLAFTWSFEKDGSGEEFGEVEPPEMLVTVEFHARGKQTELILTHEKFASVESRDRHEDGWTRCLDSLGKFVGK